MRNATFQIDLLAIPQTGARHLDRRLNVQAEIHVPDHGLDLRLQDAFASDHVDGLRKTFIVDLASCDSQAEGPQGS